MGREIEEALDRLDDAVDAAIARAREDGLTADEIAKRLRDIAFNIERGL